MIRLAPLLGAVFAIVVISGPHASSEGGKCAAAAEAVPNFQAAATATAIAGPLESFLEDGDAVRTLADFRGKAVILNFWATWCAPCIREMPALDRLQARLGADRLAVLALSVDRGGLTVVRNFFRQAGLKNLRVYTDQRSKVLRAWSVAGLPTTILIDAEGREVGRMVGAAEWDSPDIAALVRGCLGAERRSRITAPAGLAGAARSW